LRHRLAEALGRLAARLHLAGVEHADFHAANILVHITAEGEPLLSLIDLHRLHFRRELTSAQRHYNLALLHQFFAGRSTRSDRCRFYKGYHRELEQDNRLDAVSAQSIRVDGGSIAEIGQLERRLAVAAESGWRRADRAWKRGNRHVRIRDAGLDRCRGLAGLDAAWLDEFRNDPER